MQVLYRESSPNGNDSLFMQETKKIEGILATLTGPLPGKKLLIIVGIHGNEPCGINAVKELLPMIAIERGTLTIALGNPRAVAEKVRFTEKNLNRMFQSDERLTPIERVSYEYTRSRELWPLLVEADVLLDIHSSATKDTMPFVVCEPNSFSIAQALPVPLVSYNWSELEPGATDTLVNESGGMGMCIECGWCCHCKGDKDEGCTCACHW